MSWFRFLATFLVVMAGPVVGWSQQERPQPPTQGAREAQGAPPSLPTARPDPATASEEELQILEWVKANELPPGATFSDFLKIWYTPRPVPKAGIVRIDENHCYPHVAVSFKMEIVKEEGDLVWVRGVPPEDPSSPLHKMWRSVEESELVHKVRREIREKRGDKELYLDFNAEIVPPPFVDSVSFEEVRSGLPSHGLWQMDLAIADINEDGVDDLVLPPARKGTPRPAILLGHGGGRFSLWQDVKWPGPGDLAFDYGSVAVADFDRDGHQDIAIAVHFKAQHVLYGNGNGDFSRSVRLPSPDPRLTSRATAAADFDGDGWTDLAFLAEIDYDQSTSARLTGAVTLWVLKNQQGTAWRVERAGLPGNVIGDALEAADVNRDGRPDLVLASNATDWRSLVYLNDGDKGWRANRAAGVLSNALHPDMAVASRGKGSRSSDVYGAFVQFRVGEVAAEARTGVIRYTTHGTGQVTGAPLVMDGKRFDPYFRLAVGDVNGDGLTDVVTGRKQGGVEVYIQDLSGEFHLETSPELVSPGRAYHLRLLDLDGDGRDDILGCFASSDRIPGSTGGVRLWLSRPGA